MSAPSFRISRSTPESRVALVLGILALVALIAGPYWIDRNGMRIVGEFLIYLSLASMWNLLAGYAGLVSVGQQAYVGFGGYFLFAWAILLGWPPLLAIPFAGIAGAIVALPVSLLVFRLKGAYFAIGTWVVAEVFLLLAAQISVLGGGSGISLPIAVVRSIAESRDGRDMAIYWSTLGVAVVILIGTYLLLRSRWGLALQAIRDGELAAATSGVSVAAAKRLLYVVAGAGGAMIGTLIFLAKLRISPSAAFSVNDWTAFVIFITVIGGIGRIEGPIVGTFVYFLLRGVLSDLGPTYLIILGAVAVGVMLFAPKGLWGLVADRFGWQLFPVSRRLVLDPSVSVVTSKGA
ncbi:MULTISPECIES: branched-chain amino acid ABC transporter permease [unclassified Beijerinckia]|uniref:branched-chain amino acid ABC transporter permease n=1 Tax=unclassified Beijerinckia TaxID=2638183 RepID=UPI000896BA23|nr:MULTISPECIES: branched-chain amino acid ABC transporter permease [unclassified Beijerinckia]MDH7794348.1 branched-chain amino acid transport system permease protein [Beijerinckia sp. GAS462]SEB59569.1 amino acid/amide ABC transporter membrane protein 2, HAAT family [Beijerinckia sp. 28-YEA-48]